ncbi:MAG: hypothetical protein FWE55_04110, partial [Synergistaceae bacterium]|nr:hypothetical protein [Synergistaceae bacterium]
TGGGGAEMGDGGGEREDFRDTAFFRTVETDEKGHAQLSFDLPDNITSWRISWQAYSPGIYVGNGSTNIDASLDFFLDHRLSRTYLTGDEPKIGLRSAGIGIDPMKSQTSYTVEMPSGSYKETVTGQANVWQELALPKLTEGKYQVKISATNGNYKDAVNATVNVIKSFTGYDAEEDAALTQTLKPAGSDVYPTELFFCEEAYATALSGLFRLSRQNGVRLEQKLVSRIAADILAEDMGFEYFAVSEEAKLTAGREILRYQLWTGGVSSFTYAEADVETGVLAASVGKEYFDTEALSSYFYGRLSSEETDIADKSLIMWGLAALGRPVLVDIDNMLGEPGLSGEVELNLAMALYFAGDGARAKIIAKRLIADFTENLGAERRSKLFLSDKAEQTKATARLALLASAFELPEAPGLTRYMYNNPYEGDYYLLEKLGIALNLLKGLSEEGAGFTYTIDGKKQTVDLRDEIWHYLSVSPAQLKDISFSNITGNVVVTSCYPKEGRPPEGDAALGQLTLSRTIGGGAGTVTVPQDKPVRVTIQFWVDKDAPNGCYTITDMLPAGLRFGNVVSGQFYAEVGGVENKEIKFSMFKTDYKRRHWWKPEYAQPDGSLKGTIVYTAFPSGTGSFTAEAPYFGHSVNSNVLIHGAGTRITIE